MRWQTLSVTLCCVALLTSAGCKGEAKKPDPAEATSKRVAEKREDVVAVSLCEHRVPAELCTQCNPELADVFKEKGDWCQSHGVPESHCYKCNPKLTFSGAPGAAAEEAWCGEHGVPDAVCTKCKPQLIAKFIEAGDYCREHGLPESVCPLCHPELLQAAGHELPVFPKPGTKVRLKSAETEREAGIGTTVVSLRRFARSIDVVGQVEFDGNHLARLSARGEGLVTEVLVDLGDEVKRGQPLVVLASASIGQDQSRLVAAKARLTTAQSALAREQSLQSSGISPKKSVEQAQAEVAAAQADYDSARAALRAAGASESGSGGTYGLTSPFDGTVVSRAAVIGKTVSAESPLVEVANLSVMWVLLEVPEDVASSVRPGQKVALKLEGLGGEVREGLISRMSASVDPHTRTVSARVYLPNPDRSLRAGLFVRAKIEVAAERDALLVPRDAVQRAEGRVLVFVRSGPGEYEPVAVELGASTETEVEVNRGLAPGAAVVTTGAFVLKTEILKDSIGAGCTDD